MSDVSGLRVGLLGVGSIAQTVHLPLLATIPDVDVAAVGDLARATANAIANRFEIPKVYRSDDDLLNDPELDAVFICTPNHLHEEQAVTALQAGKHVLVERPLAFTAKGAERVVRAAEKADRALMVALNNRFRPDVLAIRPFLRTGELGHAFFVRAGWFHRKVRVKRPTWRHKRETSGGGALMDLGIQALDLCMWMMDYPEIERVSAYAHPGEAMEVEDSATVLLGMKAGGAISVDVSWSLMGPRDRHNLSILGTGGAAALAPLTVHKEMEHGLVEVTPQIGPQRENAYTGSYRQALLAFVRAARGEAGFEAPREQVRLMRLIELAYESIAKSKDIRA
jgi:predicted dehydrogenase